MSDDIQIRTVTVELLRSGPAHNQLLSPLTLYLGICDDAEAGIVTLPYEQHTFMRRMKAMRYDEKADPEDTLPELRAMGVELAKVLGSIPRLPGSLGGDGQGRDVLVHLSLVLSASELALLPFELAKMPISPTAWTESWLALQSRVPVVITRRTRNVAPGRLQWLKCPRILFVASDTDENNVPFKGHRDALLAAVKPFLKRNHKPVESHDRRREQHGEILTILKNARFEDVVDECARHVYTHVHILAHGATDEQRGDHSYGLLLKDSDDVVSGERLASALARLVGGAIHRPDVVTLATCDSGNQRDVVTPGASIAHVLHQAGIPLVLASQFPLSKDGSVMVARDFYSGLLWGEHPWIVLHRVRTSLHGRQKPKDHDWASLVVYEALPVDMSYQLDKARYEQCRKAMDAAFMPVSAPAETAAHAAALAAHKDVPPPTSAGAPDGRPWHDPVDDVIDRLPMNSKFVGMQALALRAGGRVQQASNMYFGKCGVDKSDGSFRARVLDCCWLLEQALIDYEKAVTGFLAHDGQGMAAPYRALVSQLSLSAVLGRGFPPGAWAMARYWVDTAINESNDLHDKLWAHGCSAELWLLRMIDFEMHGSEAARSRADAEHAAKAREAVLQMMTLDRKGDSWATEWTCNQFQNYVDWWGTRDFEEIVVHFAQPERESFREGKPSVVQTAAMLMGLLGKLRPARPSAGARRDRDGGAAPREESVADAVERPQQRPEPEAAPVPAPPSFAAPVAAPMAAAPTKARAEAAPAPAAAAAAAASRLAAPALVSRRGSGTAALRIEMLPAGHGDALWIEYGEAGAPPARVLVDCGTEKSYLEGLKARIGRLPAGEKRHFELFVMSHIDEDHIGAAIPFLADVPALGVTFGDVWFNGWKHINTKMGARQGTEFTHMIEDQDLPWNRLWDGRAIRRGPEELPQVTLPGGLKLTLLSPTHTSLSELEPVWAKEMQQLMLKKQEQATKMAGEVRAGADEKDIDILAGDDVVAKDSSKANGSSIALLAEYGDKRVLLGADVHAGVLEEALRLLRGKSERFAVDAFKLPHHGSRNNLDHRVLRQLDCRHFLVSSDGSLFKHPDREALARVVKHAGETPPMLWFNYRSVFSTWWEQNQDARGRYRWETKLPAAQAPPGLVFEL